MFSAICDLLRRELWDDSKVALLGVMDLMCAVVMTTFTLIKERAALKSVERMFLKMKQPNRNLFSVPTPKILENLLNLEMKSDTSN